MEYTHEEIIEALKVISNICSTTDCRSCCFSDGSCLINDIEPDRWVINPVQDWKAIKSD